MSREKSFKDKTEGRAVFDLLDEAYFLFKNNLNYILPLHLIAFIPFLLAIMFFIFRFENYHSTQDDIIKWSLLLTFLFCWKNFFHSLLSGKIMDIVSKRPAEKINMKRIFMILLKQNLIHLSGLISLILLIKLPWGFATFIPVAVLVLPAIFYTSDVISAIEPELGVSKFIKKVLFHISRNFVKHLLMSVIAIIGTAILVFNITAVVMLIPFMLKTFWGIETQFTIAGGMSLSLFFNTTIWSIIIAVSWLLIDPFYRILYVLRFFYGESIGKGWDLRATLLKISNSAGKTALICILMLFTFIADAGVQDNKNSNIADSKKANAQQLENNMNKTLSKLEYQWRQPQKIKESNKRNWMLNYISKAIDYCYNQLGNLMDYLKDLFSSRDETSSSSTTGMQKFLLGVWKILCYAIPILLALIILYVAYKKFRNRKTYSTQELKSHSRNPDLNREDVAADELEEHEWLKLSYELIDKKEFRLALRALFLACIRALAQRNLLLVTRYKTDYEYLNELRRRAHSLPKIISAFENNVCVFQQVWYGDYPVSRELFDKYMTDSKLLLSEEKNEPPSTGGNNSDEA
jgi:uncharacterized membrane protein